MRLIIDINVDNSAFDEMGQEIARIFREEAEFWDASKLTNVDVKHPIFDKNALEVGHWILTD